MTLRTWENERGVTLPEDYRAFLLEVGAAGAGPYYGLLALDHWGDLLLYAPDNEALSRPSPIELDCGLRGVIAADETSAAAREPFRGTLPIIHMGCGGYAALIVTGPHRGRIVNVHDEDEATVWFADYPDFLAYYEAWLDETLAGVAGSFGFARAGDESQLLAKARSADAPLERAEYLGALCRLPSLGPETQGTLLHELESPHAEVVAAALACAMEGTVVVAPAKLRTLCHAEDAAVRRAAFRALSQHAPAQALPTARRLVLDPDAELGTLCVYHLRDAAALTADLLEEIMERGATEVRRSAFYWANSSNPEVRQLQLAELARTKDRQYMILLVQSLAKSRDSSDVAPAFTALLGTNRDTTLLANLTQYFTGVLHGEALPSLVPLTRHPDRLVRQRAIDAVRFQRRRPW